MNLLSALPRHFRTVTGGLLLAGLTAGAAASERVEWSTLAGFDFEAPAYEDGQEDSAVIAQGEAQIPGEVKALNDRRLAVAGFMLPVRLKEGKVVEFLLVSDPMVCCYGAIPKLNEWVAVRLDTGMEPLMDVTLTFEGVLKVGPVLDSGYMTTIYELHDAKLVKP